MYIICLCIYIYPCVCIYIHIYIHVYMCIYISLPSSRASVVCAYILICLCIHIYTSVHIYSCIYILICIHIYMCACTYMYIYTCICTLLPVAIADGLSECAALEPCPAQVYGGTAKVFACVEETRERKSKTQKKRDRIVSVRNWFILIVLV